MITVAVEGDTDIPFVTQLCKSAGFAVREPLLDTSGKFSLDTRIVGFAKAGRGSPHLVLRDLDEDAECAPTWLRRNAPDAPGEFFALRLAVRAVEAWFLADAETAARCLHIASTRIPVAPDEEKDPKLTVVNLSRFSTKPKIRAGLAPLPGVKRKAGRDYERWLLESAASWRLDRALKRSPSLARAHASLCALHARWEVASR